MMFFLLFKITIKVFDLRGRGASLIDSPAGPIACARLSDVSGSPVRFHCEGAGLLRACEPVGDEADVE